MHQHRLLAGIDPKESGVAGGQKGYLLRFRLNTPDSSGGSSVVNGSRQFFCRLFRPTTFNWQGVIERVAIGLKAASVDIDEDGIRTSPD